MAIKKYTTHEGYTSTALQNDIAIVELETPVSYRAGIRPACLPDQFGGVDFTTLKTQPTIVGWGSTVTGGTTVQALRQVSLLLLCRFMGCCVHIWAHVLTANFIWESVTITLIGTRTIKCCAN